MMLKKYKNFISEGFFSRKKSSEPSKRIPKIVKLGDFPYVEMVEGILLDFCENATEENINEYFTINADKSVDVRDNVYIGSTINFSYYDKEFGCYETCKIDLGKKLPFKFRNVDGIFDCASTTLTTLENCPDQVTGDFDCSDLGIESFIGGPSRVDGDYIYKNCYNLYTFEGFADTVGGGINCGGCPVDDFIEHICDILGKNDDDLFDNNDRLFKEIIKNLNLYHVLRKRGDINSISKYRLGECIKDLREFLDNSEDQEISGYEFED